MAKILLVYDDPDLRKMFQIILERIGYECIFVATLPEADQALQTSAIDLLCLAELHRFGFDGLNFYKQLKSSPNFQHLPVIIYLVRNLPDWTPHPADYGDTVFVMPLDIDKFLKRVQELLPLDQA